MKGAPHLSRHIRAWRLLRRGIRRLVKRADGRLPGGPLHPAPVGSLSAEIGRAPQRVRDLHQEMTELRHRESIGVSTEALSVLSGYEAHSVLGPKYRADMLHIALATVADADVLVSWNFKHIVRFDKIRMFNAVNLEQGYKALSTHSPREVTTHGRNADQGG